MTSIQKLFHTIQTEVDHLADHFQFEDCTSKEKIIEISMKQLKELNQEAFEELDPLWEQFKEKVHLKEPVDVKSIQGLIRWTIKVKMKGNLLGSPSGKSKSPIDHETAASQLTSYLKWSIQQNFSKEEFEHSYITASVKAIFEEIKCAAEEVKVQLCVDLLSVLRPGFSISYENEELNRALFDIIDYLPSLTDGKIELLFLVLKKAVESMDVALMSNVLSTIFKNIEKMSKNDLEIASDVIAFLLWIASEKGAKDPIGKACLEQIFTIAPNLTKAMQDDLKESLRYIPHLEGLVDQIESERKGRAP